MDFVRYFPNGGRNCYNIRVKQGTNYLVRAGFFYGNYDGRDDVPRFDLYIGPNIWTKVEDSRYILDKEIIHRAKSSSLQVCLVKTGPTIPYISSLELRPLKNDTYRTQSGSLNLIERWSRADTGRIIRYPVDVYDRPWYTFGMFDTTAITTSLSVNSSNHLNYHMS